MKIVTIIPTYNEAGNIGRMTDKLFLSIFPMIHADMRLLVADDNSPDGTGDVVRQKIRRYPALHLLSGKKAGLGMAYLRGITYAVRQMNADAVVMMDADFQHDPAYIIPMIREFSEGADYVIGSRYIPGGSVSPQRNSARQFLSRSGNLFARSVLRVPISDLTSGFSLTRVKGILDRIDLTTLRRLGYFAFKTDLACRIISLSKKTVEIPIVFNSREIGRSKFRLNEIPATLAVLFHLGFVKRSDIP